MTKLFFDYYMQIDYSVEVSTCNFTIKCIPQDNERQQIEDMKIELFPATGYCTGVDGFRNCQIYGLNAFPHKTFWFRITGSAKVGLSDFEEYENDDLTMVFKHPHGLNVAGETIKSYYQKIVEELQSVISFENGSISNLLLAKSVMHCLHRDFAYRQNETDVHTTAEEAFTLGHGVCQDYAHIFIALMHLFSIPARYVTGLIVGEGASHAWVEIWQDGKWYGLDPTNDKVVDDEHIKIGVGRDAHDCMINRGIMHGGGLHTQSIKVNVCKA